MALTAVPGQPYTAYFVLYDDTSGALADPTSLTLDITFNGLVAEVPDVAGPFYTTGFDIPGYSIVRTGTGQYQFTWNVPADAAAGVYVDNWTYTYGGTEDAPDTYQIAESFYVTGGGSSGIPVPAGDIGYWTGGLIYGGLDIEFGTVDDNGICWRWDKITGWDGPDVQGGGLIPRSGDQGAYASPQYFAARQITLTVTASAPTQALRDLARNLLSQAVPVNDLAELRYDEPVPKMAMVRRAGKITESSPTLVDVTFTIPLEAPDPRKYATVVNVVTVNAAPPNPTMGVTFPLAFPLTFPAQSPGGSVAVTNNGNFETRPTLTITGPISSPVVTNVTTDQAVSWNGLTVPAGNALVIDTLNMQASLNGSYRPADPMSSWWNLPPGASTVLLGGQSDAGAALQIAWQDSYV